MLAGAHAGVFPITSSEAAGAMTAQIHKQLAAELRGGFHGATQCSGQLPSSQVLSATTRLTRWRCTLELSGVHLATPCKAEANVFATNRPHHVRIGWLAMSQTCHAHSG
jgi:hypothetical protein